MSYEVKKIVHDKLVDDATMRGLLGCSSTGSAPVAPIYMERSGVYPQIVFSETFGPTDPGMNIGNGRIDFIVQVQATGSVNPHKTYEDIANRISGIFDDRHLTGSASYIYHFIREGGPSVMFDEKRQVMTKIIGYSYKA